MRRRPSLPAARALAVLLAGATLALAPREAEGLRPFDATDASVLDPGQLQLELAPLVYVRADGLGLLYAPRATLAVGLPGRLELGLQGTHAICVQGPADEPRSRLIDTALVLKGVVREGSLQGADGVSLGVEVAGLLPTVNGESGLGAAVMAVGSHDWGRGVLHGNAAATLTRAGTVVFGALVAAEGPATWPVRPALEATATRERERPTALSGLAGVIWAAFDGLDFDLAVRGEVDTDGSRIWELRAGLTWATAP